MYEFFQKTIARVLSPHARELADRWTLRIGLAAFFVHLGLIAAVDSGIWNIEERTSLLTDPIAAIYTPFSVILIYEVYLLVFYLPRSITTYIGKQYEIITLIVIRRIFKDLASIELSSDWFENRDDLIFTADIITSITLFFLIYVFYRLRPESPITEQQHGSNGDDLRRFIKFKQVIATLLVPVIFAMACYSFGNWTSELFAKRGDANAEFKDINSIFFEQFFVVLIVVDVTLLLISFFHTDEFHKVMRNSGFIISTILIRQSFSVVGPVSCVLIVAAVLFGLGVLWIHNQFETKIPTDDLGISSERLRHPESREV